MNEERIDGAELDVHETAVLEKVEDGKLVERVTVEDGEITKIERFDPDAAPELAANASPPEA